MSNQMKVPITMQWRPIAEWSTDLGDCVFTWSPYADDTGQPVWFYMYRSMGVPGPSLSSYFVELVPPLPLRVGAELVAASASARDWKEDYANGENQYRNDCSVCSRPFYGHKYRAVCVVCWVGC